MCAPVLPCTPGYENEVLVSQVSQMQSYQDRIDEMDSMTLHAAQLEQTNARCAVQSTLPHRRVQLAQ